MCAIVVSFYNMGSYKLKVSIILVVQLIRCVLSIAKHADIHECRIQN